MNLWSAQCQSGAARTVDNCGGPLNLNCEVVGDKCQIKSAEVLHLL